MTTVTLELSDRVIDAVRQQAQSVGKDFTQHLQEHIETFYQIPETTPAHRDPSRYITLETFRLRAIEKHGFPSTFGLESTRLTDDDWAAIEAASTPDWELKK